MLSEICADAAISKFTQFEPTAEETKKSVMV